MEIDVNGTLYITSDWHDVHGARFGTSFGRADGRDDGFIEIKYSVEYIPGEMIDMHCDVTYWRLTDNTGETTGSNHDSPSIVNALADETIRGLPADIRKQLRRRAAVDFALKLAANGEMNSAKYVIDYYL